MVSATVPIRRRAGSPTACTARRPSWIRRPLPGPTPASGARARRPRVLRIARRGVHSSRHLRGRHRAPAAAARPRSGRRRGRHRPPGIARRPRRHRHRDHAGGRVPGIAQLGVRRRPSLCPPIHLRRPARVAATGRRLSLTESERHPGCCLQPPGARGQLPGGVRALLHRSLQDAMGRGRQLRWCGRRRRAPPLRGERPGVGA